MKQLATIIRAGFMGPRHVRRLDNAMPIPTYDPNGRNIDVFQRANHVGDVPFDNVTSLRAVYNSLTSSIQGVANSDAGKLNRAGDRIGGTLWTSSYGRIQTDGDIFAVRNDGNTGGIFFTNAGNRYIYWDGANYNFAGGSVILNGYLTVNSSINVTGTDVKLYTRWLRNDGSTMGFLGTDGGWCFYNDNGGSIWTKNYGWLHDRFADRNAQVNYNSGTAEFGSITTSGGAQQTYDLPAPWVMTGLRSQTSGSNDKIVFIRATVLRNN